MLKIGEDKDGRKYRSKDVWDIITEDKITTKLIVEEEDERETRLQNETMNVEDRMLSQYAEELIDAENGNLNDDDGDEMIDFDPASMISNGADGMEEEETEQPGQSVFIASKKINIKKAKVNMLAFSNFFKVGDGEMRKKDYVIIRIMKMKRKERSMAMRKVIYDQVSNDNARTPTVE